MTRTNENDPQLSNHHLLMKSLSHLPEISFVGFPFIVTQTNISFLRISRKIYIYRVTSQPIHRKIKKNKKKEVIAYLFWVFWGRRGEGVLPSSPGMFVE